MKRIYILTICFALFSYGASAQKYVKPTISGTGDGSSWVNASGDLQGMINASAVGEEVWVVAGTYKPTEKLLNTSVDDRDKTFILRAGVKIYGGFNGSETLLAERDIVANETILSGDLNNDNIASTGDYYHIVASAGNSTGALLDGFTLQNGFADGSGTVVSAVKNQGGAINITDEETTVTFKNLIIKNNQSSGSGNGGGGIYLRLSGSSNITFDKVTFDSNKSSSASGGNLYYKSATGSPTVTVSNSKVFNGSGTSGAGFYALGSSGNVSDLKIFNTIFSQNRASSNPGGGAMYLGGYTNTTIINCTFYNNSNVNGAIAFNGASHTVLNLYNSIFNKNSKSTGNLASVDIGANIGATLDLRSNLFQLTPSEDTDPEYNNVTNESPTVLFMETSILSANFLKLVEGAATEKGANTYVTTNSITTDLGGATRITHTNVDLGAYEYQGVLPIELQSFSVKKANNGALLEWKVASETDNEKFIIQRSVNGSNFEMVGEIYSIGNHSQTQNYSFTDFNPLKGDNYYQLSQIDKDGSLEKLALKVLSFDFSDSDDVTIYPNPASDFIKIKINGGSTSDLIKIRLVALTGYTVLTQEFKNNVSNEITLKVGNYAPGIYVLVIENGKAVVKKEIILN
jgi:hypothetical protein